MLTMLLGYFFIGVTVAAVTMYIFRPVAGYRPPVGLVVLAITVYTLLWPLLVLLAAWYHWRMFLGNRPWRVEPAVKPERKQRAISRWTVSKPR